MPVLRFAPYRVIAQEVATRLLSARGGDPLAAWDEEVIVPSRGVAEAIATALLTRRPEGIAGLRLQTLEELAQRLLASVGRTPRVASDAERRLAMRTAVRSVDHPLMESRGVAAMLERGYRDVRDSGITLAELSKRVSRARGLRDAQRTNAVIRAWSEYERLIAKLSAIDGADRFAEASALPFADIRPQLLAGFYDVTGAQWNLIESLLRAGRIAAMWVPTEERFADRFIQRITPYADVVRDPAIEIAKHDAHATRYDTRDAELHDVCDRIRKLLDDGTPAHEIGIVARSLDPHDARLLNRFAAERAFATTLPEELPLAAHRIGRGAMTLLRLRERNFPRADVLELVRDGLLVHTRLNADAADEATRRARIAGGTSEELQRIRRRPPVVETYIALVAELEQLTATIDLDFVSRLGAMFRITSDLDLSAAERLDEIAAVFRRASVWNQPLDPAAFLDAIEQESLTQKSSATPMIWAGELLRFRGRSFSHLFVVRMQDEVFPQRRTPDPLLPDSDRERLGLPLIGDGRDEETLLFSLLGDSASHVHHSFAAGDGFGKVLRPSRFLRTIATEPRQTNGFRVETPASPNIRRQLQRLTRTGTSSAFDGYIGSVRAVPPLSPTQLEDFGECPQKFLVKHVLGARDIDDPEHELQINIRDKGTYDHRILERFYSALSTDDFARAAASRGELPADLAGRLEQCIEEEFERLEQESPAFNATVRGIERRATSRILRDFVVEDIADLDARGLVPKSFEYRFGTKHGDDAAHPDPFVIETNGSRVLVEGTIDRIDTDGTHYRIVDYKSGKAFRHRDLGSKIDRGVRLQLALYAMAVAEFFEASAENVSAAIRPLVVSDDNGAQFEFALHEKRDGLLKTLGIFIAAIKRGDFPAFPDDDEINSCKYCPVNHSCRTRHDADERYAMAQHKDPRTLLGGGDE